MSRVLVTGGAGFIGSHLCKRLVDEGHEVICLDNLFTGSKLNIEQSLGNQKFEFIRHDITERILLEIDEIYHLACPASPIHYQHNPIKTAKTNFIGTLNMLGLAKRTKAKILLASTSEIYGDPEIHPQVESYHGNVSTQGLRACYDEGKRIAETLMVDYNRLHGVDIRIARIFNTYGPRMSPNDGRVISNFIVNALDGKPLLINGDGLQTRSFCYVDDTVTGLIALMNAKYQNPVNIGNPDERTIYEIARYIIDVTESQSAIEMIDSVRDDPRKRKPDIALAKRLLDWRPEISFEQGLKSTISYFQTIKSCKTNLSLLY